MLDQLDEWGYALDDFLADHPDIDLSFRQSPADPAELTAELATLPADYVAQPGWVAIDAWPENDASPTLTIDPRADVFMWPGSTRTNDGWYSMAISPAIPDGASSVHDLADGVYAVTSLQLDPSLGGVAVVDVRPFVECGDVRFSLQTGLCWEMADFAPGRFKDAYGIATQLVLPLDDRLTVRTSGHAPCWEGGDWLCWTQFIGTGPDLDALLADFANDMQTYMVEPGLQGVSATAVGNALVGSSFSALPPETRELTAWTSPNGPSISLKSTFFYGYSDDELPPINPLITWLYRFDETSESTCQGFAIERTGGELPADADPYDDFPCTTTFEGQTAEFALDRATAGGIHVRDGRIGLNLPWETTGG